MVKINPNSPMNISKFFLNPKNSAHRQYEALRAIFVEKKPLEYVAKKFKYTKNSIYSLIRDCKKFHKQTNKIDEMFFIKTQLGRKAKDPDGKLENLIISLRKKNLSVLDIKAILDSKKFVTSEKYIYNVINEAGFARLPRRTHEFKNETLAHVSISADKSELLSFKSEQFNSSSVGIFCFAFYIVKYEIDKLIIQSKYPGTKTIPKLNSILSFLALKLSNFRRYSVDDLWCMDRCLGLFAGLNVLPKAAWFTSYSHRITRDANISFLKNLNKLWKKLGLLSDTTNLDFVTVPYWGEDNDHLENNWSGTRHQALTSILAAIAEDPDSGIITYGDATVRHENEADIAMEFLDFYHPSKKDSLKYLVFDSKFTTYQNLRKINDNEVKFITIRKRGKKIVKDLESLPKSDWKNIRVECSGKNKTRLLKVIDKNIYIKDYGIEVRQVAITGHGKIKPALIITNDFELSTEAIIRKYCRRWLVEKKISEQTHFFHLNKVSSSMVIKVDFDLTMTILAHNIYRLLAQDLFEYSKLAAVSLYEKFIYNVGTIKINDGCIEAVMRKKRNHPALISAMEQYQNSKISWLNDFKLKIEIGSST